MPTHCLIAPKALPRCRESDVGWTPEKTTRREVLMMSQSWHASSNGFLGALLPGFLDGPTREHPALGDRHLTAAPAEERDEPRQHRDGAVAPADEVVQVQAQPGQPGQKAAEFQLADLAHRGKPRDRRHAALVEVLERLAIRRGPVIFGRLELVLDLLGGVDGALNRALGHAWHIR